jgi:hypothetical protein
LDRKLNDAATQLDPLNRGGRMLDNLQMSGAAAVADEENSR